MVHTPKQKLAVTHLKPTAGKTQEEEEGEEEEEEEEEEAEEEAA